MNDNDEIRYKLLLPLYDKFYKGDFGHNHPTDEIITESGLQIDLNTLHAHIDDLTRRGHLNGLRDIYRPYPFAIGIDNLGIVFVERHNRELAEQHGNIRFRVLSLLYDLNFEGHFGEWVIVDSEFMNDLGLSNIDENMIHAELIYLRKSGLILGTHLKVVRMWPDGIRIDTSGIRMVESIIDDSLRAISSATADVTIRKQADEILTDANPRTKKEKFLNLLSEHEPLVRLILNVIRSTFSG